eukprot:SAG22_NODE_8714_length_635_cov_1.233209_1_plen_43_part_10
MAAFELSSTGAAGFVSDTYRCALTYERLPGAAAADIDPPPATV